MKRLLLIALLLTGCGQQQSESAADISSTTVVWQGYVSEDSYYSFPQKLSDTMQCLNNLSTYREGEPYVVVVKDTFSCLGYPGFSGCYSNGTVYVTEFAISPNTTIVGSDMFKHEVIHWATGLGNESHSSVYFTKCS